jgi:tetratricopeptide (TPR) repeat protein
VSYRVAGKSCTAASGGFDCLVKIERTGATRMPLTVGATFEDGTVQRARTERLADIDELHFQAKSPLRDVTIDPDHAVVMAEPAAPSARSLAAKIQNLPWTGAGAAALELYREASRVKLDDIPVRVKLALMLYDGRYYQEALEMFKSLAADTQTELRFDAAAWEGVVLDLLGRRAEALAAYHEALQAPGQPIIRHDQYGLRIDKKWVEERLQTPFERK